MDINDEAAQVARVINELTVQSKDLALKGKYHGDIDDRLVAAISAAALLRIAREGVMTWPQQ